MAKAATSLMLNTNAQKDIPPGDDDHSLATVWEMFADLRRDLQSAIDNAEARSFGQQPSPLWSKACPNAMAKAFPHPSNQTKTSVPTKGPEKRATSQNTNPKSPKKNKGTQKDDVRTEGIFIRLNPTARWKLPKNVPTFEKNGRETQLCMNNVV